MQQLEASHTNAMPSGSSSCAQLQHTRTDDAGTAHKEHVRLQLLALLRIVVYSIALLHKDVNIHHVRAGCLPHKLSWLKKLSSANDKDTVQAWMSQRCHVALHHVQVITRHGKRLTHNQNKSWLGTRVCCCSWQNS